MGGLVQQPPPPRADRQHPARRGRGALLCRPGGHTPGGLTHTKQPPANPGRFTPLQLTSKEKAAILRALDGDIYTETRIRLPLLLRLDSILSAGGAVYDSPIISVEHVLPQTPQASSQWMVDFPNEAIREAWVHRLANLVLLTRRKNSQANNADFALKKGKYFSTKAGVTNFALTSQVLSEPVWTPATLQQRQKALTDEIARVWRLR